MIYRFIFILLCFNYTYSQNIVTVYFDTDKYTLNTTELNKLMFFNDNDSLLITKIIAFCDFRASEEYNKQLALRRVMFVKEKLKPFLLSNETEIRAIGENFSQSNILSENRKVEITYKVLEGENIQITNTAKQTQLSKNVAIAKVGEKLILENLNFYNRSGIIVPESRPILIELFEILKENPKLKIEIQGHICCQEKGDFENISNVRAKAIYDTLIKNGINENRLKYKSFGSSMPLYSIPEKNEDERNANRRVEILIIEN
ncbi:OmpA family protein [Flavobacterium sp.]|uniref:OmpA family protein n=1 Tax=Flavobacterium sp. TaxID=239 RepID=UPI003D2B2A6F